MIPPVFQPGDVLQRVRMPNAAGVSGKSLRVVSVSGNLVQLEWESLVSTEAMQSALTWAGIYAQTTDPGVAGKPWNNAGHLVFSAGASLGIGSMSIGSTFIVG